MPAWLTVIGIGDGGLPSLTAEQRAALETASHVVGGRRHLAMLGANDAARHHDWSSPFEASRAMVEALRGQPTVVLASGDPCWFGPVAWLHRFLPADDIRVLPSPSSFSLAAARLGWPLEHATCLSAHGRPVAALAGALGDGKRLLVLSADAQTPAAVAALLDAEGFGASRMIVCEHLGGPCERVREARAESFALDEIAALNLIAVECIGRPPLGLFGLPDDVFRHDGKMTKRPLRVLALAALCPRPGALLWDIGAGCGSIGVEWARMGGIVQAVEPQEDRRAMLAENARRLAGGRVEIVAGMAPAALEGLAAPDAVFIGGGLSHAVFDCAFAALRAGGSLVAHAVTLESEAVLMALHGRLGGQLTRVAIAHAAPVGQLTGWRPQMPVTHWHIGKDGPR